MIENQTASPKATSTIGTDADWKEVFQQTGCAIIKGVISPERAAYYQEKQIDWLKKFGLGFDEKDESTWTTDHLPCNFKGG